MRAGGPAFEFEVGCPVLDVFSRAAVFDFNFVLPSMYCITDGSSGRVRHFSTLNFRVAEPLVFKGLG